MLSPRFTLFPYTTLFRSGLIRVRNIRALNGRFNTSITHAYSIFIGSKSAIQGSRSEERFSRNAETDIVCRLLLEKKNGHRSQRRERGIVLRRLDLCESTT